ncbi:uncharacterized protein LOC106877225 [Octopus bimaculoides]|uniref:Uncharacterized protein n=1 Tax=Octopus bimaculoides TaxID=37653 RepID=A0A0L8GGJ7_OCTBM|nr:uncharacterized protein LOC106877225 [Octopus bimaculoides]XP_052832662.1 uncharacterized protein LOC106877225 [Octopus bimaculoides]|eukprot:XP_014781571.1 PREDICTED: uncharacterized protein LOC106877225 [Octopus bimaculoides]
MGNWISGTQDPEADVATPPPSVLSLHQRYSLDPRSPSTFFKRTPILVCDKPNPIIDPRSPSFEINRTPLFCSYHKENEVTTTQVPQPATPFTSSPMVTKIKPLCFEGDSEREEEEEERMNESSYLSIVSEQNISTHHNITLAQPGYLSDQMTDLVTECSITDQPDICCDSVSKLDDQGVSVVKLSEPDDFSNSVSESDICSDPGHLPLDEQVSTQIAENKQKETEDGNLEKNHCSDADEVTDVTGDVLNMDVGSDGSYINSNTTPTTTNDATTTTTTTTTAAAVTCTDAGHKLQLFSVGALDRKERSKASSIPLAVKKKPRTEAEVGQSAFDNCNEKNTAMSLQQHHNNIYKNKKTTKAVVAAADAGGGGGGVVSGVRSPLQSRNCGSIIAGNNRYRSSLAKMPARANVNSTGGAVVKTVSKPVFNWGLESSEVKFVHDKENMSIRWPK